MGLTFTDQNEKIVLRAEGRFQAVVGATVKAGDLLAFLNTGTVNAVQLADQSTSVPAQAIAIENGVSGDLIWCAETVELKAPTTQGVGGSVTQTNYAASSDFLGSSLYLSESGKASSSVGSTYGQAVGYVLARERIVLTVKGVIQTLKEFDAVVDAGGNGDHTTIQAADDVLDAAAYSMLVKQGTYAAGFTVDTNNVYIFVEPGTVIQAAITLEGTGISLVLGAQCDVQGLITLSGANCSLICLGGVDMDGISISGADCLVDGGGWDTLVDGGTSRHAVDITAARGIVKNISLQTSNGVGGARSQINCQSGCDDGTFENIRGIDAEENAITIATGADRNTFRNVQIFGADDSGFNLSGAETSIVGCKINATGGVGIDVNGTGDNSVFNGNIIDDITTAAIRIATTAEDCVVVGNRCDGAITDNSGTSTVASNDTTAF